MLDHVGGGKGKPTEPLILLVDDDQAIRASLSLLLETHGYRVITTSNGLRGVEAFRTHHPAVVVMDVLMPEQDGIGALLAMRRERPDAKIVLMSGRGKVGKADYLAAAQKLGASATLEKMDAGRLLEILPGLLTQT